MKKISLKNLNFKEVEQLSREQLKEIKGGEVACGENEHYDAFINGCVCNDGYYFSYPFNKCIEGAGPSHSDPYPKITACKGKQRYDLCGWEYQGEFHTGRCDYRFASPLYCVDTLYV